ncbi:MAG: phosphonate ABC transporter ATP-binding protein [Zoogloeaceae bacterium]|jgi:phosphonate transport system ATP-binding protein|nr:phosphonate ABC transporter ATP-binding protein [Zoogloeaceae bacterium]
MANVSIGHVEKRFGNGFQALKGVSAEIESGSFTVVLGPSGAGKSTLLRLVNGLETPSAGQVAVAGRPVTPRNLRAIRGEVGMVFQHFNLVDRLSVMTNVLVGRLRAASWLASLLYLFRREDMEIAHHALARVGLVDKSWERACRLSGGQQQRVGIARALAQRPRVILADEPVASLDPATSEEIMQLLREICRRDGITLLVNLHQVDLARRFADRILGLNAGQLVFDGSPAELDAAALERIYRRAGQSQQPQQQRHFGGEAREESFAPALAYA